MPLRKLWNSICGKSTTSTEATKPDANQQVTQPKVAAGSTPGSALSSKAIRNAVSREDKKLFRRIESMSIRSVLEVSVGDGCRALAMLQTLVPSSDAKSIHYIAIDEFEMGGNSLTLRAFHKRLREFPAKAQLVPMKIDAGLDRVVRTYGQVDLIIWASDQSPTTEQQKVLARLSKPNTIVFSRQDDRWSETLCSVLTNGSSRRAA